MAAHLSRLHHISLHVSNAEKITYDLVSKFKFNLFAARLTDRSKQLAFRKGAAVFVVNETPKLRGVDYSPVPDQVSVVKHDNGTDVKCLYDVSPRYSVDTVCNVCFEVDDVERSFDVLQHRGCDFLVPPTRVHGHGGLVTYSVVKSVVGNVCHTLIDRSKYEGSFLPGFDEVQSVAGDRSTGSCPITHFDHITYACSRKTTPRVMQWYEKMFGFQRFFIDRYENCDNLLFFFLCHVIVN